MLARRIQLTYAGNLENLASLRGNPDHIFVQVELRPKADGSSYASQISYVSDRPGHDRRYAIDARKIERELGWKPAETFGTGIRKTVEWYLANPEWVAHVQSGSYREWVARQYSSSGEPSA